MHRTRNSRRLAPWALALALGLAAAGTGTGQPDPKADPKAAPPPPAEVDKSGAIVVPLGGLRSFDPKVTAPPTKIEVSREDVLGVRLDPDDPRRLYLTGKVGGISKLTIVQDKLPNLEFEVVVKPDLALLRKLIRDTVPTASVTVEPGLGNTIILSGYVTSPQDATYVLQLASSAVGGSTNNIINAVQVGGVQQVQIDVVVASVNRTQLRQRGFDFAFRDGQGTFNTLISGLLGPQAGAGGAAATLPTFTGDPTFQFSVVPNRFLAALRVLRTEGVAKFLAEPRVVTQTGRPAFFRAGGQQAILSATSGITGPGVTLVPFGTELEVVPIVYGNGAIWLDINPRITAVNQGLGIAVGGANSPGFDEQSVRSTVLLESGQTFAIGGLIQRTVTAGSRKVPVLGDLPYIGAGFSSITHNIDERELVILVTPRLVHPMDPCQAPKRLPGQETRTPDDYELFLENVLEAPRGQRKVWNGKCYNAPYKCDPTANKYPCQGNVCTGPNGTCLPAAPGHAAGLIAPQYAPPAYGVHGGPAGGPGMPGALPTGPAMPAPLPPGGAAAPRPDALKPEAPAALPPVTGAPAALPEAGPGALPPLPVGGSPVP